MDLSKKRTPGLVNYKFDKEIDLEKADEFIKNWLGYCLTICREKCKDRYKIEDSHVFLSVSLEALVDAFHVLSTKFSCLEYGEGMVRKVIRTSIKQTLHQHLIVFGYIKDKKRVYFPTEWVSWEEYFMVDNNEINLYEYDIQNLIDGNCFTESEVFFINFIIRGYEVKEIAQETGYGIRWICKVLNGLNGRLSETREVDYRPPYKYGKIGPYKKKIK